MVLTVLVTSLVWVFSLIAAVAFLVAHACISNWFRGGRDRYARASVLYRACVREGSQVRKTMARSAYAHNRIVTNQNSW